MEEGGLRFRANVEIFTVARACFMQGARKEADLR